MSPRPKGLRKDKVTGKWYMPIESQQRAAVPEELKQQERQVQQSCEAPQVSSEFRKRKPKPIEWKRNDMAVVGGRTVLILGYTKYGMVVAQTLDGERLTVEAHRVESMSKWISEEETDE